MRHRSLAWTLDFFDAMRPFAAPGVYVNYLSGDEGADGLKAAYGAKLAPCGAQGEVRPSHLFRMNLNIAPASVVGA